MKSSSPVSGASFRDPSGFVFTRDGVLYRQVNRAYQPEYDRLYSSGLHQDLAGEGLLISHEEVDLPPQAQDIAYKVIRPERVPLISYPYEWSFSQLKDAALATLEIQKRALDHDMSLKDASAYNIQFMGGRPVLIDTLSFEAYREGEPWIAYRQFCQHFLAPLALMAYRDARLSQLMRVYIDGVPLDLASKLLPLRTRLDFNLSMHIHLHAAAQQRYSDKALNPSAKARKISRLSILGLVDSLRSAVRKLSWKPAGEWAEYYQDTNYSAEALEHKRTVVSDFLDRLHPATVWDLGANTGVFSRLASERGVFTAAFDVDPGAVEKNYQACKAKGEKNLLPLVLDLTNPSPATGWQNDERMSIFERGPVDAVMGLALIHHMAISNNVPLDRLASFFSSLGRFLILEFVPKSDSQVQRLLSTRADIFSDYHEAGLENAFSRDFKILECVNINDSQRRLYLMERV
ncbi:MAG: class I SAM-dependent methyltransferase [Omnitrophica WOR_2 bacterium]